MSTAQSLVSFHATSGTFDATYSKFVNPQWAHLLDVLSMNVRYVRCQGVELTTDAGRLILDFLSGYCVHNIGHNHPHVIDALKKELTIEGPVMLQSHVSECAGLLAERLVARAGGRLRKVFFPSTGSEGVEAAIKFSRAHTHRDGLLYMEGSFHGLSCGALSLMGNPYWREGFGPLLADAQQVDFDQVHVGCRQFLLLTAIGRSPGGVDLVGQAQNFDSGDNPISRAGVDDLQ